MTTAHDHGPDLLQGPRGSLAGTPRPDAGNKAADTDMADEDIDGLEDLDGHALANPVGNHQLLAILAEPIADAEHRLEQAVRYVDALHTLRSLAIHAVAGRALVVDDPDDLRMALAGDSENVARLDNVLTIIALHLERTQP